MLEDLDFRRNTEAFSGISCLVKFGRFTYRPEDKVQDPEKAKKQKRKPQTLGFPQREGSPGGTNNRAGQTKKMRRRRAQKTKKARQARSADTASVVVPVQVETRHGNTLNEILHFTRASDPKKPSGLSKAVYKNFMQSLTDLSRG